MTHPDLVSELRVFLREGREKMFKLASPAKMGHAWLENYSLLLDTVLGRIFAHAWNEARFMLR